MTDQERAVMQQALDLLESASSGWLTPARCNSTITALRYIKQAEDNITYGPSKAEGEQT
jgi:hypothetical protein